MTQSTAVPSAQELLANYASEQPFFFATPEHTLLGQGHYAKVPSADNLLDLSKNVDAALKKAKAAGHPNPVVVGAIPFDGHQTACLSIPQTVLRAGPLASQPLGQGEKMNYSIAAEPAPQVYAAGVAEAVERMKSKLLSKVVLARTLSVSTEKEFDVGYLLARLAGNNASGYTFAVNLDDAEQGTLIGASPELLLSRNGVYVRSNPLAGSAARAYQPQEDARRCDVLLNSAKDLYEHKVVADAVAANLRPFCSHLVAPASPNLVSTATMWHLASDIRGQLQDESASSLWLAAHLHPTPAVCGYPNQAARDLIAELEPFDRGFYTGMVGWCDAEGNGEWIVTIRCAKVKGKQVRLFAGAGVVVDSTPQSELTETAAKFKTMLNALGLSADAAEGAV
ncbi:isochorismate synthase DhbC [Chitinibacter sp. SCUT-21]|uniref:isochorismate synthase DhbC n=1 Tax=Chitinibacter sp. SCUT-21 TaxID=2970891 RepID=UPI0035A73076